MEANEKFDRDRAYYLSNDETNYELIALFFDKDRNEY